MADPKTQAKINKLLEREKVLRKDLATMTGEAEKKQLKAIERLTTKMEILKAGIALKEVKEMGVALQESARHAADLSERSEHHLDILKNSVEKKREQLKYDILLLKGKKKLTAEQIAQRKTDIDTAERKLAATERLGGATKNILETTLGISDSWKNTFVGSLMSAEGGLKQIGATIADTLNPANMLGSTLMKVQEATFAMVMTTDSALSGFNKMTGAAGSMDEEIFEAYRSTDHLGVSMADTVGVAAALRQSMGSFKDMSKGTRQELIAAAGEMTALGISGETAGRTLATLQTSLGMTANEAIATQRSMAAAALEIGMAPSEMAEGFQRAMPTLAAYGKKAPAIFKEITAVVKGLNVSMETMLGQIERMDTFEGAADAAGRLAQALGGHFVNSMDLLAAEGADKVLLIKKAFDASGKNWESIGRFERRHIALAAGFKDIAEFGNLVKGSMNSMRDSLGKSADEQKRLADAQKAGVSIMEKLTIIGAQFAVLVMPIIDGIRGFLDGVLELNESMDGKLIPTIVKGLALLWAWGKAWKLLTFLGGGLLKILRWTIGAKIADAGANVTLGTTSMGAAAGTKLLGKSAGKGALGLLKFSLVLVAVAVSMYFMVEGLIALIKLFIEHDAAIAKSTGTMLKTAGAITALGLSLMTLYTGLLVLAVVAIPAAAALGLLGAAFWLVEDNFKDIATPLSDVAKSFKVLADAMDTITPGKATAFGQFFDKLAYTFADDLMADRILMVATAMQSLASSIEQLPESKTIALTATLEAFEGAIDAAIKMKPEMKESLAGVVASGSNAALSAKSSPIAASAKSDNGIIAAITGLFDGGGGKDKSLERPIVLEINGDRFATVIVDLLKERYDLRVPWR
jgi:hypothetical protein